MCESYFTEGPFHFTLCSALWWKESTAPSIARQRDRKLEKCEVNLITFYSSQKSEKHKEVLLLSKEKVIWAKPTSKSASRQETY